MTNNLSEKTKSTLYEVSFDNDKPHGAVCEVEQVKPQGPVFVVLPGNGFNQHDMGYKLEENVLRVANKLRKYLESAGIDKDMIKKLPFYVVTYQSPDGYSDKDARTLLYKKHGRNNMPEDILKGENGFSEEEKNPAYIEQLYRQIAEARVSRLDGKVKVGADTAAQNMAQVFVFAHCHGAYTALKLEEVMKKNMQKLGYTNEEIGKTQKQIIVTAYAPACPLGVSKMNFVSFKSLNDTVTKEEYNNISVYASMQMDDDRMYWLDKNKAKKENSEHVPFNFNLSFYPDYLGNVFVIKQKSNYDDLVEVSSDGEYFINENSLSDKEHNNTGDGETQDSKDMHRIMTNVLANACRQAFKQAGQTELSAPLSIPELAVGTINPEEDAKIFNRARQAGIEQGQQIKTVIAKLLADQRH